MSDWISPYFTFNGNCEEAVNFYQKVLGGEAVIMHLSDAPSNSDFPVPDHMKNLVIHAELRKDSHVINFCDNCNNSSITTGNNISFAVQFDTKDETKAMFDTLAEEGLVEMELQETFFSPLYGKVTDRFGMMWQIVCKK